MTADLSLINYDPKSDITTAADIGIPAVTKTAGLFVSKLDLPSLDTLKPHLVLRKQIKRQEKEH